MNIEMSKEDLIKFYQAHIFGNETIIPDYIKREMQRTQFRKFGGEYGFGFLLLKIEDTTLIGHGGGYPGFVTQSGFIQDQKIVVVILSNAVDGSVDSLLIGIVKILNKLNKNKEEFLVKEQKDKPDFSSIIGFYGSGDWGTPLYSQIGSKLVSITPKLDNPLEGFTIYKQEQDLKFTIPKGFPSSGQPFEFIDGSEGEKILIDAHQGKYPRFKFTY